MTTEQTFTPEELARRNNVQTSVVYRAIRSGRLPSSYEKGSTVPRVSENDWAAYRPALKKKG